MVHTVRINDRSPKAAVRDLLKTGQGPRDFDGMIAVLDEWLNDSPTARRTFPAYCKRQSWTLGQVLSFLEYQCSWIFGEGVDSAEFEALWPAFQQVIKTQELLDITRVAEYLAPATPKIDSRAAALEV